ncbi:MAG: hypothetical protein KKH70_20235 [Gammaproteobacteria bacterium]|nr:hypothetical protein [Gammaproteobacteria bacterium]
MNLNEIITNVTLTKACSIKADKDSTESKQVNLKVKFDGALLSAVFDKAVAGAVIQWQNGPGRKGYDDWKANQTIEIQFTSPGAKTQIDPEQAMIAKLKDMTPEMQLAYLTDLAKKVAPPVPEPEPEEDEETEEDKETEEDETEDEKE